MNTPPARKTRGWTSLAIVHISVQTWYATNLGSVRHLHPLTSFNIWNNSNNIHHNFSSLEYQVKVLLCWSDIMENRPLYITTVPPSNLLPWPLTLFSPSATQRMPSCEIGRNHKQLSEEEDNNYLINVWRQVCSITITFNTGSSTLCMLINMWASLLHYNYIQQDQAHFACW